MTTQSELFCEHSAPFLGIWPTSGSMRSGAVYRRPEWVPPIPATASSSSPGLLKTPGANLGSNGGPWHPDKRKAGGHGPTLEDRVAFLLPTPKVTDTHHSSPADMDRKDPGLRAITRLLPTPRATDGSKGGPNQRGSSGDPMLPAVVSGLLPTPKVTDSKPAAAADMDQKSPGLRAISRLLPTPSATDAKGGRNATAKRAEGSAASSGTTLTDWAWLLDGESTDLPSPDGEP